MDVQRTRLLQPTSSNMWLVADVQRTRLLQPTSSCMWLVASTPASSSFFCSASSDLLHKWSHSHQLLRSPALLQQVLQLSIVFLTFQMKSSKLTASGGAGSFPGLLSVRELLSCFSRRDADRLKIENQQAVPCATQPAQACPQRGLVAKQARSFSLGPRQANPSGSCCARSSFGMSSHHGT